MQLLIKTQRKYCEFSGKWYNYNREVQVNKNEKGGGETVCQGPGDSNKAISYINSTISLQILILIFLNF